MDLLHFGHCLYLGSGQYSCADSLNISIQTFGVIGYQISSQDKNILCYRILILARSDWFHYCIIVCTVESIPVDCNLYF